MVVFFKVEKMLEDSLNLIPLTSLSVKIQIIGGKVKVKVMGLNPGYLLKNSQL